VVDISVTPVFHIFTIKGYEDDNYRKIKVRFRGDSLSIYLHQLACWVGMNFQGMAGQSGSVSHLCHLKSCGNPAHLVFECMAINNARQSCYKDKQCIGHGDSPSCIFN